jgi:N4-gp56 family major capsid protein
MDLTALDPTITQFSEIMGENAGESIETIVRDIVGAGTNVMYAAGRVSRVTVATGDKITALDILKIRRQLKRSKVKKIKLPNGKLGYLAFMHTDVVTDLMQTDEWKAANTYVDTKNTIEGTAGQLYGIYIIEYDLAQKFAGAGAAGADVYGTIIIGKGAFGIPDVAGSSKPKIIVKLASNSGTEDPLEQRNTVGWKAMFTGVRLQELAIVRYECAATA